MLNRIEAFTLLVSLVATNDVDSLPALETGDGRALFAEDHEALLEACLIVRTLFNSFDFTRSPRFARLTQDHSEQYAALKCRFESEPSKRTAHQEAFRAALGALLSSDAAYALVPFEQHPSLDRLRVLAASLQNPA